MEEKLNIKEAYKAMFIFLDSIWETTQSDYLCSLLGSMSLLDDDQPADAALWEDWIKAVEKVKTQNTDINLHLNKE